MEEYLSRMVAAELMSSAFCNAQCKYCYIPKVQEMKELHQDIVKDLESDRPLNSLKELYGDKLECISLWGTEPTLILNHFTPNVHKYIEAFPKLKKFSFSTNLLTHYDTILKFMEELERIGKASDRKFEFDLQISLDGPAFITDTNRQEGATEKILRNYESTIDWIGQQDITHIRTHIGFKPTLTIEQLKMFNDDYSTFDKYFSFFDEVVDKGISKNIPQDKLTIGVPSSGTLMVPGKYTSQDGREFGMYMRNLCEYDLYIIQKHPYKHYAGNVAEYVGRLQRILRFSKDAYSQPAMFTCSGGDSNFGLDRLDKLHICHRSFYLNEPKYVEAVAKSEGIENWDVSMFDQARNRSLQRTYMVDIHDPEAVDRYHYSLRGFHDFTRFKENYIMAMLLELVDCGQASEAYRDPELARLLARFIVSAFGCSIENLINTGSIHLTPLSVIRLLANGAFEQMVKHYVELEVVRR